jgi:hypothetical protein
MDIAKILNAISIGGRLVEHMLFLSGSSPAPKKRSLCEQFAQRFSITRLTTARKIFESMRCHCTMRFVVTSSNAHWKIFCHSVVSLPFHS